MTLLDTITLYGLSTDAYGDAVRDTGTDLPAQVELTDTWHHAVWADSTPGTLIAWIAPDPELGKLTGLEADYDGIAYRIVRVQPSSSLLTGEPGLTELHMVRLGDADEL